ncbi:MAG: hypothetical protein ACREJB_13005 [Planctomycetaceae bacterium]
MSQANYNPQFGPPPKPQPTLYTGLMFVAFAALAAGIIFLVLLLGEYGWQPAP